MKNNGSSSDKMHTKTIWPWREVRFKNGQIENSGRSKAALSKHFLNLRPEVGQAAPAVKAQPVQDLKIQPAGAGHIRLKETGLVFESIFSDIKAFGRAVSQTLKFPYHLLSRSDRFGRLRIFPKVSLAEQPWTQLLGFALAAFILVLPFKGIAVWQNLSLQEARVLNFVQLGAGQIKSGADELGSGRWDSAEQNFRQAAATFDSAAGVMRAWPDKLWSILRLIPGKPQQYAASNYLITTSHEISQAAALAVAAWRNWQTAAAANPGNIEQNLQMVKEAVEQIKYQLDSANANLAKVEAGAVPLNLRDALVTMQAELKRLTDQLDSFATLPEFIKQALAGANGQSQTLVVIFQNPSELRPTGGFMGSLALLTLKNGQLQAVSIPGGGPYDFQGQLKKIIRPPEPLRLVRGVWQLQDANWWFDFPASAQKILWFLQESGAPPADGVVAVTAKAAVNLLKLTGPISLPNYGKTLTADNFYRETQKAVEIEYDRRLNRPKQFIADLAPLLVGKAAALPAAGQAGLFSLLAQSLTSRDLQVYFKSPELESRIQAYGWGGEIKAAPLDYLAIVRTNIGGGKTDLVTREKVSHSVNIAADGTITVEVKFSRQHQGNPQDLWESRRNVDYVRFYVPLGSTLLEADGFTPPPENYYRPVPAEAEYDQDLLGREQFVAWHQPSQTRISEEAGKTVFANWLSVSPGETASGRLLYRLPFVLRPDSNWQDLRRYQAFFQHQAGTGPVEFSSQTVLPDDWRLRWQRGSGNITFNPDIKTVNFTSDWTKDDYYGLIVEKIH